MPKLKSAADLETRRQDILARRDPKRPCVTICSGTGCHAYGSEKVARLLRLK
jgi:NADH-quinone oxidoreductase subunit F